MFCSVTCIWYVFVVVFDDVVFLDLLGLQGSDECRGEFVQSFGSVGLAAEQRQTRKTDEMLYFLFPPVSSLSPFVFRHSNLYTIFIYIYYIIYTYIYIQIYSLQHAYSPGKSFLVTVQRPIVMSIAILEDAMKSGNLFFFVMSCTNIFKIPILKSESSMDRPQQESILI